MSVSIKDKQKLFKNIGLIQDDIWHIQRMRNKNEDELRHMQNSINKIVNDHSKIIRFINQYERFQHLNQNKFDNLISFIKIMEQMHIDTVIDVQLIDDPDFNSMWSVINDHESVAMDDDEYQNILKVLNIITDRMVDIHYDMHKDFENRIKGLWYDE